MDVLDCFGFLDVLCVRGMLSPAAEEEGTDGNEGVLFVHDEGRLGSYLDL